jgi:hypothetical protein
VVVSNSILYGASSVVRICMFWVHFLQGGDSKFLTDSPTVNFF